MEGVEREGKARFDCRPEEPLGLRVVAGAAVSETSRPRTAAVDALDLVPLTFRSARVCGERFQELEVNPMKPKKDISRMSVKQLKFRYGKSGGTDKVAEDELRRRGLNDRQIHGIIHGYRQGEYTPKGGPYPDPEQDHIEKQAPSDDATEPNAASVKERIMYSGPFKGLPLSKIPEGYLAWEYGSFTKGRKRIERELRSRGRDDEDLEHFKKKYPCRGKSPKKQVPKD